MPTYLSHFLNSGPLLARKTLLKRRARAMRHNPTPSEARLWTALQAGKLGVSFRRQAVIADYIVDFVCHARRLIIEVNGNWHLKRECKDASRLRRLRAQGYRILEVSHNAVMTDLGAVLQEIQSAMTWKDPGK